MAEHRSLPVFVLFLSVLGGSLAAQGPSGSAAQTSVSNAPATGASQQPLPTVGQAVAQGLIDAQWNAPSPVIFLPPPPKPTFGQRTSAFLSNNIAQPTSQFWDDFWQGVSNNKWGAATTLISGAIGVYTGWSFDPAEVSVSSELFGVNWETDVLPTLETPEAFKVPTFGIAPSFISGALMDSSLASTASDIFESESVVWATAEGGGSNVIPTANGLLLAAKGANDIAEQGAKSIQPQLLPVEPIPDTVLNPLSADSEVQISTELVGNEPPVAVSFSAPSIVDDGPLIRPQAITNPSSGGFWNLQNLLQIVTAASQAYSVYENSQPHTQAARRLGRTAQSSTAKENAWCGPTKPPELCASAQLLKGTCSIRNDCSKWADVPSPPPSTAPSNGCSIQCMTVGYGISGLPIIQCVGNAFTPACPIDH